AAVVRAAAERGLTHLAITDHDRIDAAVAARSSAPSGLTVIVGEEIKTRDGDLVAIFLERAVPPGLSARETVAAVRDQGGLVGLPHPFDSLRGSVLRDPDMAAIIESIDWVEAHNARVLGGSNHEAATFALDHHVPGVAVTDAHSVMEVAVAYTALDGDPGTPAGLLAALPTAELVVGRASYLARLVTPVAKLVQRTRGNGRIQPATDAGQGER
ncbi:MAG: PHP-associated domain-containing protein, partial [Chloroflexota bacterium]